MRGNGLGIDAGCLLRFQRRLWRLLPRLPDVAGELRVVVDLGEPRPLRRIRVIGVENDAHHPVDHLLWQQPDDVLLGKQGLYIDGQPHVDDAILGYRGNGHRHRGLGHGPLPCGLGGVGWWCLGLGWWGIEAALAEIPLQLLRGEHVPQAHLGTVRKSEWVTSRHRFLLL